MSWDSAEVCLAMRPGGQRLDIFPNYREQAVVEDSAQTTSPARDLGVSFQDPKDNAKGDAVTHLLGTPCFLSERSVPAVADQPTVELGPWRAVETLDGGRRLLGVLDGGSLRVTSLIECFEPPVRTVITFGGRRYELKCAPEEGALHRQLMLATAMRCGFTRSIDASHEIWRALTLGADRGSQPGHQ